MQIKLDGSDLISPSLLGHAKKFKDRSSLHAAIGLGLVSIAKRSFTDASLRPATWANKKDGSPSNLRDTGTLAKSLRVISSSAKGVTIGSDRRYAAIHQLGGKTKPHIIRPKNKKALFFPGLAHPVAFVRHPGSQIPARPFLPFDKYGQPTPAARKIAMEIVRKRLQSNG